MHPNTKVALLVINIQSFFDQINKKSLEERETADGFFAILVIQPGHDL
jgi:hypothetical protein